MIRRYRAWRFRWWMDHSPVVEWEIRVAQQRFKVAFNRAIFGDGPPRELTGLQSILDSDWEWRDANGDLLTVVPEELA